MIALALLDLKKMLKNSISTAWSVWNINPRKFADSYLKSAPNILVKIRYF